MKRLILLLCICGLVIQTFGQTPTPAPPVVAGEKKTRTIQIKKGQTLLNLPVNPAARTIRASIKSDGKAIARFNVKLSENPTFWTFFNVTAYQGKTLTLEIENPPAGGGGGGGQAANAALANAAPPVLDTKGLDMIFADIKYPGQDSVYKEKNRPQVHFSSQRGWINDPNGLVYYNGEYHLYYQHNPYGWENGNKHWGHAVSTDLLHWKELKTALFPVLDLPDNRNDAAFSGSATYDPKNTGGFRRNGIDPLIAFYTSTGRGECIMLSYDNGRTFEEYAGNPVVTHTGRDPKVFWYEPGNHWVMVVWDSGKPKKIGLNQEVSLREHSIYTSPNLKTWTYQSGVDGFFECPELFELPIEGMPGVFKWVMYDAFGRYVVGTFDGKTFNVEQPFKKYDYGGAYFYASQTFDNSPDKRRIQVGWGRGITHPGMPFNQAMLFPTELKLRQTFDGLRLTPTPIREISTLHKNTQLVENKVVTAQAPVSITVNKEAPLHIIAEFERGDAPLTLNIMGYDLRYDNEWAFTTVPAPAAPGTPVPATAANPPAVTLNSVLPVNYVKHNTDMFKIEAIVDKNIIEFYVNDGELYYSAPFNGVKTDKVEAVIRTTGGGGGGGGGGAAAITRKFIVKKLEVHELSSIWP